MLNRLTVYLRGDGFQARAFRGAAVTMLNFGGQNALRLASNLILTRLLFPEAFGLMALASVVLSGALLFSEFGLRGSVISDERGDDPAFLNTVWALQIIRGIVLCIAIVLLAHPLANFYEEPLLADILLVLSVTPLIQGLSSTRALTADRDLQLSRITFMMLFSQTVGIAITVLLAWWFETIWALVIGAILPHTVMMILTHTILPGIRNRLCLEHEAVRRIFSFGKFVSLSAIASFFAQQGNQVVLGKYVELDELGFYRIALFLAILPAMMSSKIVERVIYPLYARRPPIERPEYRRKINGARILMTSGFMTLIALMALIGDWLAGILYDDRYSAVGMLIVLIATASLPGLIVQSYIKLPLANGKSGRHASFMIARAIVLMTLLLMLVPNFGVIGAIIASPLAVLLTYPLLVWIIMPFGGWDPVHDIAFALYAVLIVCVIFWVHHDIFTHVETVLFGQSVDF